jgi:hypothetical protein
MILKIDFLESYDDAFLLDELKRIANLTKSKTVTKNDIVNFGRIGYSVINKHFGSLRKALELAELNPSRYMKASDEELYNILIELWEKTLKDEGRTPYRKDLRNYDYHVSGDIYLRRFGSWKKALKKAYEFVSRSNVSEEISELIELNGKSKEKRRKTISLTKRFFVLKRDSFTCVKCGANGPGVRLEVDHDTPVAKEGSDSLLNLQTLCFDCNRGKRDKF